MFQKKIIQFTLLCLVLTSLTGCTSVSKEVAGQKAQDYLTKYVLKDGIKSTISEVKDENGFYTVALQVKKGDEIVDKVKVYVTKDGENLSLGPIFKMSQPPAKAGTGQEAGKELPKADKPKVDLFVMSGCPFGLQAEAAFAPVMKILGDQVDFTPRYVIYENYQGGGPEFCLDKDSKLCSMHGIEEAKEDVRQICIWQNNKDKWWDYIEKFNAKCDLNNNPAECSKGIATELGIDFAKIETCAKDSGEKLLAEESALNKKYKVEGSPTIIINETNYEGNRAPNDLLGAICNSFKKKPEACNQKIEGGEAAAPVQGGGCGK